MAKTKKTAFEKLTPLRKEAMKIALEKGLVDWVTLQQNYADLKASKGEKIDPSGLGGPCHATLFALEKLGYLVYNPTLQNFSITLHGKITFGK